MDSESLYSQVGPKNGRTKKPKKTFNWCSCLIVGHFWQEYEKKHSARIIIRSERAACTVKNCGKDNPGICGCPFGDRRQRSAMKVDGKTNSRRKNDCS